MQQLERIKRKMSKTAVFLEMIDNSCQDLCENDDRQTETTNENIYP